MRNTKQGKQNTAACQEISGITCIVVHLFKKALLLLSFFLKTGSHYVAQVGLEFSILLSHPLIARITGMYHPAWLTRCLLV
jgi:hypothetical protein